MFPAALDEHDGFHEIIVRLIDADAYEGHLRELFDGPAHGPNAVAIHASTSALRAMSLRPILKLGKAPAAAARRKVVGPVGAVRAS
ncbi:hypothetical protein WME90_03775 [Sorangium sp. So ce375]|uniref:hypothetical protein n=1 Tax=Sorangium sp. So ce375 TaxID=3133306 RepID=UPI003F5B1F53